MEMTIEDRAIDTVRPYEGNPRVNDQAVDAVARSIEEFGFRQPVVVDSEGVVICGHTRLKAAQKLGLKSVPVHVADLPPEKVKALRLADNQTGAISDWDWELLPLEVASLQDIDLSILGFDEDELTKIMDMARRDSEEDDTPDVEPPEMDSVQPEALKLIEECDRVVLQYSGGKDSTVALNWARGVCAKFGKPLEAVFVETGAEFPDLTSYIIRTCEKFGVELVLLRPKQNILQYYCGKRMWPDSLYRDCLHKFINDPVNRHIRQYEGQDVICVRGGRSDQKTSLSKSNLYQEVKDGDRVVRLLNPFFGVDKAEYEKALEEVRPLLWKGYERGFLRTACWCCPFQKVEQWDALRENYPLLWDEMRNLSKSLEYKHYRGDTTRKRFHEYWRAQGAEIPESEAVDAPADAEFKDDAGE